MGAWSNLFFSITEERNEQDVDWIWAKALNMKKEDEETLYRLMRDKRERERIRWDNFKNSRI